MGRRGRGNLPGEKRDVKFPPNDIFDIFYNRAALEAALFFYAFKPFKGGSKFARPKLIFLHHASS